MKIIRVNRAGKKMQYKLRRQLLKLFPERKDSFESDLRIAIKDHPGYNETKLYEELINRYSYKRKCKDVPRTFTHLAT